MQIAKIVGSNSHIEYIARVLDTLDVANPPKTNDYTFGQFVKVEIENLSIIGVIANTQLINPDYGNFAPRLSSESANLLFSPDYLHQQGVIINILLLGYLENNFGIHQIPSEVLPVQSTVSLLSKEKLQVFHRNQQGQLQLNYYSQITGNGGFMANSLLLTIINKIEKFISVAEKNRLNLLKQNLNWQQTLGYLSKKR
jgi:hypothetical protein